MCSDFKYTRPMDIENQSFKIIEDNLKGKEIPESQRDILKRVIHASADFDYVENLVFSENAVEKALEALKNGANIITDTNMALSGINKKSLQALGINAYCFISDEDVAEKAAERGITRAMVSMEKSADLKCPLIFAIGNAPTALLQLDSMISKKLIFPRLIIGVPVGFVNVAESKEIIMKSGVPYIVARGNKGGSNIAAAICNALLYKLCRK